MHKNGEGNRGWFSVDSKSFEISLEGEGKKFKGIITEIRRGIASWIRFGEEGIRNLLTRVETFCKEGSKSLNGRRMEGFTGWRIEKMRKDAFFYALLPIVKARDA